MTHLLEDNLPKDVLFSIALRMDGPTLRNFCQSHKRANAICLDPYFQDAWIRYHDQLTFDQRDKIDNIIDQITEKLIEEADFEIKSMSEESVISMSNEDIKQIKKTIRDKYRTTIGRDLRPFILAEFFEYLEYIRTKDVKKIPPIFIISFLSFLKSKLEKIGLVNLFLDEIPINVPKDRSFNYYNTVHYHYGNWIRLGLDHIFEMFGVNSKDPKILFRNLVHMYPELAEYRNIWDKLFSTIPTSLFI